VTIHSALQTAGIARADAEILLATLLGKDRSWLLAHHDADLAERHTARYEEWIRRRRGGEPIAYIIGERAFYGRSFSVDRRVLIPRPSTENLVSLALDFLQHPKDEERVLETGIVGIARRLRDGPTPSTVVDVGTGSGCIAITLALERPELTVIATDISRDALEVAKTNARRYGVDHRITFLHGDLLQPVEDLSEPTVVITNPPYLSSGMRPEQEVLHFEPHIALVSGTAGNEAITRLTEQMRNHPCVFGYVLESAAVA
jgi:release factor glutamine methyltransferase